MVPVPEDLIRADDPGHDGLAGVGVGQRLELAGEIGAGLVVLGAGLDRPEGVAAPHVQPDCAVRPAADPGGLRSRVLERMGRRSGRRLQPVAERASDGRLDQPARRGGQSRPNRPCDRARGGIAEPDEDLGKELPTPHVEGHPAGQHDEDVGVGIGPFEHFRETAIQLAVDVQDPVLELGGRVRLVPGGALVHEVPELVAGAVPFVEHSEEQVPVLALVLADDHAGFELCRLQQLRGQRLERRTGAVVDVASPGVPVLLRPAVRDGVVPVSRDDVVDVVHGVAAATEAGAVSAPVAEHDPVQPGLRQRVDGVDHRDPLAGIARVPPEPRQVEVVRTVGPQPRLADVHLLGLPVKAGRRCALAGGQLCPERVRQVGDGVVERVRRGPATELREGRQMTFRGPAVHECLLERVERQNQNLRRHVSPLVSVLPLIICPPADLGKRAPQVAPTGRRGARRAYRAGSCRSGRGCRSQPTRRRRSRCPGNAAGDSCSSGGASRSG